MTLETAYDLYDKYKSITIVKNGYIYVAKEEKDES